MRLTAFSDDAVTVARKLLGQRLVRVLRGRRLAGTIVEVEAYLGADDRAAHSYGGRRTARNESMYLAGGHAYIYLVYGMHHCFNVVCGHGGEGMAVLVRALEPTEGRETMFALRSRARRERDLCRGPGRLAEALALSRDLDGVDLRTSKVLYVERLRRRALPPHRITATARVGVGYAGAWARRRLRFLISGSQYVSPG
jgi:DNA-3-methyladenine glycosylase